MANPVADQTALVAPPQGGAARKLDKVPFVEMFNGRLQGVVSSDSDVARVYCAFIEVATGDHYSSTNNNRPDAGMPKRLRMLVEEAAAQFGQERVERFLQLNGDPRMPRGARKPEPAGEVFSRFLSYLRFVERQAAPGPVPEMAWFVSL
jgi:hypothetical protein